MDWGGESVETTRARRPFRDGYMKFPRAAAPLEPASCTLGW
jgi:hypothetical protein